MTVGILKIITFGFPKSENGALSAILTEGNCAERPKAALSPIPIEGNCRCAKRALVQRGLR